MTDKIIAFEIRDPGGIFNPIFGVVLMGSVDARKQAFAALSQEGSDTLVWVGWNGRFGLELSTATRKEIQAGRTFSDAEIAKLEFPVIPYMSAPTFTEIHTAMNQVRAEVEQELPQRGSVQRQEIVTTRSSRPGPVL